jgi:hypothetical protein
MSYPKNGSWISPKYRKYISEQPCLMGCGTGELSAPHHEDNDFFNSGMGTKPPDTQCLPLCNDCHINKRHRMGAEEFWGDIDYKREMVNFLTRYLIERNIK